MISTKFINTFLKIFVLFFGAILTLILVARTPNVSVETLKGQYTDFNSQFISIDGLEVHYKDEGSGSQLFYFTVPVPLCTLGTLGPKNS